MTATIEDMVRSYLASHGYEGLCNPDAECGCSMDDLFACCEPNEKGCRAAYRFACFRCEDGPNGNNDCQMTDGEYDYMMSTKHDFCHPMYWKEDA